MIINLIAINLHSIIEYLLPSNYLHISFTHNKKYIYIYIYISEPGHDPPKACLTLYTNI